VVVIDMNGQQALGYTRTCSTSSRWTGAGTPSVDAGWWTATTSGMLQAFDDSTR